MMKKIIFILIAIGLLVLTGCFAENNSSIEAGVAQESDVNNTDTVSDESEEVLFEPRTITIWNSCEPRERIALMENINEFANRNNLINIEVRHFRSQEELEDQFEAASLAGAGPEILLVDFDAVPRLAPENVIREITQEINYSLFLNGLVEISEYNNRKYIIPFISNDFLLFYYNQDLIGEPPQTFNQIIEYSLEYNNPDENLYAFLLNGLEPDWIIPFIGGYSEWILDYRTNSLTLDTNSTKKTLDFLNLIFNEEQIAPYGIGYEEINNSFKEQNTAMIINGSWALEEYRNSGINFGVSKIPRTPDGIRNPTSMMSGLGFLININNFGTKYDASMKFINYMLSDEVQVSWAKNTLSFPAKIEFESTDTNVNDEIIEKLMEISRSCRGKPNQSILRAIRDAVRINSENVILGNISSDEAALKIQEDAIKLKSGGIRIEAPLEEEQINGLEEQDEQ
jgi:maltose-binding protein MalE